jgi:hypothetical protein
MIRPWFLLAAALLLSPLAARAQVAPAPASGLARIDRRGFDLGLRLAYALPMGSLSEGVDLGDAVSGVIPLQVDALYRINGRYAVGAYAGYGFAFIKDAACGNDASCSGSVLRLGVEGIVRFAVAGSFIPWVGAGLGYESLKVKASMGATSTTTNTSGFELLNLQGGGELVTAPDFAVGPFVSLSIGQYRSISLNGTGVDIPNKGIHEWFQIGIRGVFSL